MKYRPEIDGLRAVAVGSVILAHAGLSQFSGGFVGVDVFFVISGYLITKIIHQDILSDRFSIWSFYERRARRILPALVLVIVITVPFAWYWMLPDFLENFGQSVVATLLFSNNLLLARTTGYWELESSFKPLLHTWSLGVEEQFYIVFPILMLVVFRFSGRGKVREKTTRRLIAALAIFAVLSLTFAQIGVAAIPSANFYLPFGRAWELLVGGVCALVQVKVSRRVGSALATLGLLGIVGSVLLLPESTPSPSVFLLPAVIGAALVVMFADGTNVAGQSLSIRPLVGLGLISYSAYLWHQPVFALARVRLPEPPSGLTMAMLTLVVVPAAYLSWCFVEQPFRNRRVLPLRIFAPALTLATVLLIAGGGYLHVTRGWPDRVFPGTDTGDIYIAYNQRIHKYSFESFPENGKENVLVAGNSFARDVANTMIEGHFLDGKNLLYRSEKPDNCKDILNSDTPYSDLFREADYIVLTGIGGLDCLSDLVVAARSIDKKVLAIGPKDFGYNLNPFIRVPIEDRPAVRVAARPEVILENENHKAKLPPSAFLDLLTALGGDGRTVPIFNAEGQLLSPDRTHFTKFGAKFAAPIVVEALNRLAVRTGALPAP